VGEKQNIHRSYGEKIVSLFARLLFSQRSYSLTELSKMLGCSKPTVLRLVDDIGRAYGVDIEESFQGNRKFFRMKTLGKVPPAMGLNEMELDLLYMCQSFAEHLLGHEQFEETTRALLKSHALIAGEGNPSPEHFAVFRPGTIDYTPHQDSLRKLIEAMDAKKVCKVTYRRILGPAAKTYYLKPLKIFSHRDTVYLHARFTKTPGELYQEPEYDPLFAIHRILEVELTDRPFEFPKNYDFDRAFNKNFGIMKGEPFEVEVEFTDKPAEYVAERRWSPDQRVIPMEGGKIRLLFTSSSKQEMIPWVLSFGELARVIRPVWLVEEIGQIAQKGSSLYDGQAEKP